jgi:hypothetical protein
MVCSVVAGQEADMAHSAGCLVQKMHCNLVHYFAQKVVHMDYLVLWSVQKVVHMAYSVHCFDQKVGHMVY